MHTNSPCKGLFIVFLTVVMFFSIPVLAQTPHFSHTTIYVTNLQKSSDFYKQVMQLEQIAEPFHDNKHTWFKIGEHGQLHVVSGATAVIPHDINIHLAFAVPSLADFMKHLDTYKVKYGNWAGDYQKS